MLIKSNSRWDAVHALINTILKDGTLYCNNCGMDFDKEVCCEDPHIGSHKHFLKLIVEQNRLLKSTRANEFASTKNDSMRWGLSLPPRFLATLEKAFRTTYGEKLFRDAHDIRAFAKKFRQFSICERV